MSSIQEWSDIKLKYIAKINPSKSEISIIDDTKVTFLPMENILSPGNVDLSLKKSLEDVYSGYTYFKENDLIVAKVTPCFENGNIAIMQGLSNGIGFGTTELHVIRVNEGEYNKKFFYYALQADDFKTEAVSNMYGVGGLKRIPPEFVCNYKFKVPPIQIQNKVVEFLEQKTKNIQHLIDDKERLITLLEEQRQSIITEAVTKGLNPNVKMKDSGVEWIGEIPEHWSCSKFKYVGKLLNGYAFPSTDFTTSGVRVIKITNIQSMNIDWSDESFIDETYYDKLPQFRVYKNDLVFALTRPIISSGIKAAIVNAEEKILLNQRNALYRSGNSIISSWLYYIMLHKLFVQEFESYIDRTGQQPNISSTDIENIKIPIPKLEEQYEIVNYLDNECNDINDVITKNKKLIEKLKDYRQSLIYEAVTGKIDVRDFEIEA
ncbi:restriction endonuclease subunit S [Bacillus mobilis]|uniref:restriction endonuclease subunit S n=1 Tax=Bacillus mobilis TaxID=2026190 RepID=UPI0021D3604B|nr:restriction endonuclease subunit S [Bacillus mobilis]MCU5196919.1 restriction endonuclease subunit S [Bacillus mobilis]